MKHSLIKQTALLCALLLVPAIVSCGQGAGEGTETAKDTTPTTTLPLETVEPLEAAVARLEGIDYGGHNFRVLDRSAEKDPNWITIDVFAEEADGDTITDAVYRRNTQIEDKINIKITEIPVFDPYVDAKKLIMAGGDDFDVVTDGLCFLSTLAVEGYLADLQSISELKLSSSWWDQELNNALTIGGNLFFATGDISIMDNYGTWCMMFNKTIASDYDVGDLYQMVRDGKWTFDVFYNIAKETSKDTNGDGKMTPDDQWGFLTESFNQYGLWASGGQRITSKDKDDYPTLSVMSDRSVDVINLASEITSNKACTLYADTTPGGCGFTNEHFGNGNAMFIQGGMWLITKYRSYDVEFGVLPAPKFDETQDRYYNTYSNGNCTAYSIPTTAPDLARTGTIMEAMAEISKYTLTPAYYDVALKGKYVRDEESAEMLDIILASRAYDLGMIFNWGNMLGTITGMATSGNSDFASLYAMNESAALKDIENFVEQLEALE